MTTTRLGGAPIPGCRTVENDATQGARSREKFSPEESQKVAHSKKAGSNQRPIPPPESGPYSVWPSSTEHTCLSRGAADESAGSLGSGPHHHRCQVWPR